MNFIQFRQWCRDTFKDYVVFTKSIFFILGLVFGYKLVEKAFLDILMTILRKAWKEHNLRKAVVVVNLQEGTSAVLGIFFAFVADVYTGRYVMVLISTGVCFAGLFMNIFAASNGDDKVVHLDLDLFYPALGLMTLAQAAETVSLEAFLDDQLRPRGDQTNDDNNDDTAAKRHRRSKFWWTLVSLLASIFVQAGPLARQKFKKLAIILTALMGACFFLFLSGTKYYNRVTRDPNPFKNMETVIIGAISNRKADYRLAPEEPPHVPWLRWLDRAAIATENQARPSSGDEVRRVKLLLKMLPLWTCFLSLSLVVASGSTFFFEEVYFIAPDDTTAIGTVLLFTNLQRFTEFMVSEISSYLVEKLRERKQYNEQKMELIRVGVGLSFSVLCCIAAWATTTASMRRKLPWERAYLLCLPYILLGVMTGLSLDGIESFYKSQVSESLARFGPPFGELVMGVGRFMSIICILVLSNGRFDWFGITLADSRIDKYYILLGVLSLGNVVIYCSVAYWYGDDSFLVGDDQEMGIVDQAKQPLLDGDEQEMGNVDQAEKLPVEGNDSLLVGDEQEMGNVDQAKQPLVEGLASPSTEGQHITRRAPFLRRASEPNRILSSSRETMEEYPLLPSASTNNRWRSNSLS